VLLTCSCGGSDPLMVRFTSGLLPVMLAAATAVSVSGSTRRAGGRMTVEASQGRCFWVVVR
jgi:hypothetical protein